MLRTSLNGSALARWLVQKAVVDAPPPPPGLVEGLGRWLHWTSTIPLSAALNTPANTASLASLAPAASLPACDEAEADLRRTEATLAHAIDSDTTGQRPQPRGRRLPDEAPPPDDGLDFTPYRERHLALQRAMEAAITPLRERLRAALATRPGAAPRLAAIDAVLAELLDERAAALLAALPGRLERRFEQLRRAAPADAPPAWLAPFRTEMRQLLHAELALRLQPAQALLDALRAPAAAPTSPHP